MKPRVGIIMGSSSDWETMQAAADTLESLSIAHEVRVISAHRTPDLLFEYAASARERGLKAIIAGAGGAAHLPGMTAAKTTVPVLGVPVQTKALGGVDSLLSIAQMPSGIPVATFSIGAAGARNAALFAVAHHRERGSRTSSRRSMHFARRKPRQCSTSPTLVSLEILTRRYRGGGTAWAHAGACRVSLGYPTGTFLDRSADSPGAQVAPSLAGRPRTLRSSSSSPQRATCSRSTGRTSRARLSRRCRS